MPAKTKNYSARWWRALSLILVTPLALATSPARADDLSLLLNGTARHMPHDQYGHLNEKNWGLGLQYDFDKGEKWFPFVNASEFKDSNYKLSWYFGGGLMRRYTFDTDIARFNVDAGVVGFLMHREGFRNGNLFPGILPALSVGTDRTSVNITYVPKVEPKMVALWFFQLKMRIGKY